MEKEILIENEIIEQEIKVKEDVIIYPSIPTIDEHVENKIKEIDEHVEDKTTQFNNNAEVKTNEFNSNASNKIKDYNANAETKIIEFNNNANSYDERIAANEEYLDKITSKNTASGELVHITDALNLPIFENKISGNIKQEGEPSPTSPQEIEVLEGYNLAKLTKGKTPSVNNGQIIENITGAMSDFIEADINETYNLIYVGMINQIYLFAYDEKKNFLGYLVGDNIKNTSMLFSKHPTTKYVIIRVDLPGSGHELPQVQFARDLGVTTIIPYGCVGVEVTVKNKFNLQEYNQNSDNVIVTKIDDNNLKIEVTTNTTWAFTQYVIRNLQKNTNYKLLFDIKNSNSAITDGYILIKNIKTGVNLYNSNSTGKVEFNTGDSTDFYIRFGATRGTAITNTAEYSNIMLCLASENDTYEPYQKQLVPLDLKGNWVGKINDSIEDYLVTDKKKYWLVKNVGKLVLTGAPSDKLGNFNDPKCIETAPFMITDVPAKSIKLICNRFIRKNLWGQDIEGIDYSAAGNYLVIHIKRTLLKDTSSPNAEMTSFKRWLSENNVEVYYELAEPKIIELGELPEPIKTFEGTNNIQVLANLDTEIEVKYAQDLKKEIEILKQALLSTGANI